MVKQGQMGGGSGGEQEAVVEATDTRTGPLRARKPALAEPKASRGKGSKTSFQILKPSSP